MLRISKLADYGTVVMVYLSKQQDKLCSAREIAIHTHLTVTTVSKLLKRLSSAGLLTSVRGTLGGYRLARVPEAISVAEIIYALEDNRGLTECSLQPNECSLQGLCPIQGNWQLLNRAIQEALGSISLHALSQPVIPQTDISRVGALVSGVERV